MAAVPHEIPPCFPDMGMAENKPVYGLHGRANKVAPLFLRNGHVAYLIELRGNDGTDIGMAFGQFLRKEIDKRELSQQLTRLSGDCGKVKPGAITLAAFAHV